MRNKFLFIISLSLLTSCSLWDDYQRPETDLPQAFENKNPATPANWPDLEWWKQFSSPQLTALVDAAKNENYDLKAAMARVDEADAQVRISGAALLPSIEADGDATRSHSPSGTGTGNATGSGGVVTTGGGSGRKYANNSYRAVLSASYELDFWGKNWSAEESARALAQGSRFDQETVLLSTVSSVANTYFDYLITQERYRVANENLKNANVLLESYKKRQAAGINSALDVAQQQSLVDNEQTALPPLQLRMTQDKNALAILTGRLPEDLKLPEMDVDGFAIPVVGAGLPSELLQRRPDVQYAEAELVSANANIINARAQFFPNISLTADGGYASSALSTLLKSGSSLFSLGASITQPIFEGGLLTGQFEYAKARYNELLQNYRKSVVNAFSDVENALAGVEQAASEEAASLQAQKTAQLAYDLSNKQFKSGIVDITTVLNTQRTLFVAQDSLLQARLSHLQAIVTLYQALGGGWKNDEGKI